MRINDYEDCEDPILEVRLCPVPTDVELWIKNENRETIGVVGLEELLKYELNGEGNGSGDFVLTSGADKRWERSAQIFERMAIMIRAAMLATYVVDKNV